MESNVDALFLNMLLGGVFILLIASVVFFVNTFRHDNSDVLSLITVVVAFIVAVIGAVGLSNTTQQGKTDAEKSQGLTVIGTVYTRDQTFDLIRGPDNCQLLVEFREDGKFYLAHSGNTAPLTTSSVAVICAAGL
jgi:heme/copper-type cytochrome/quinol oxidase subunit 2